MRDLRSLIIQSVDSGVYEVFASNILCVNPEDALGRIEMDSIAGSHVSLMPAIVARENSRISLGPESGIRQPHYRGKDSCFAKNEKGDFTNLADEHLDGANFETGVQDVSGVDFLENGDEICTNDHVESFLDATSLNKDRPSTVAMSGTGERPGFGPCYSRESNLSEFILHDEYAPGSSGWDPRLGVSSNIAIMHSVLDSAFSFDAANRIPCDSASHDHLGSSNDPRKEIYCDIRNMRENLHTSSQLDACEYQVLREKLSTVTQDQLLMPESFIEISCPSKCTSDRVDEKTGYLNRFQPAVASESGMELSAAGWNENGDAFTRKFCSNDHSMEEDWLCSSPQCDEFTNVAATDNSQCQLQNLKSCLERCLSQVKSHEDVIDDTEHFQVNVSSTNCLEPSNTRIYDLEDKCEANGLCFGESIIEEQLCSVLGSTKTSNLQHDNGSEPSNCGKNEVGDGCRTSGSCSDTSNTQKEICESSGRNACNSNVHKIKRMLPLSWGLSQRVCTANHDKLTCTEVLCSNESNMGNHFCPSGNRKKYFSKESGSKYCRNLEKLSYNEDVLHSQALQNEDQGKPSMLGSVEQTSLGLKTTEEEKQNFVSNPLKSVQSQGSSEKESPSTEGPPDAASYCAVGESASPQSLQPYNNLNHFSEHLVPETFERRDACCSFDYSSQALNNEGNVEIKGVSRNTQVPKSKRLTRSRKVVNQPDKTIGIFSSNERKKRSYSNQRKSLTWGSMNNIEQMFEKKTKTEVLNIEMKRARNGVYNKRQLKSNTKASKERHCGSNGQVYSKFKKKGKGGKMSWQTVLPNTMETPASDLPMLNDGFPASDCLAGFAAPETSVEIQEGTRRDESVLAKLPFDVGSFEKLDMAPIGSFKDDLIGDRDPESTVSQETPIQNSSGNCLGIFPTAAMDPQHEAPDNIHMDPRASSSSDMQHLISNNGNDACVGIISTQRKAYTYARRRVKNDSSRESPVAKSIGSSFSSASHPCVSPGDTKPSNTKCANRKKGKSSNKCDIHQVVEYSEVEGKLPGPVKLSKAKKSERRPSKKAGIRFDPGSCFCSPTFGNDSCKVSKALTINPSPVPEQCGENMKAEIGLDSRLLSGKEVGTSHSDSWMLEGFLPATKSKGCRHSRRPKASASKKKSHDPDTTRTHNSMVHMGAKKNKVKDADDSTQAYEEGNASAAGVAPGGTNAADQAVLNDISSFTVLSMGNDLKLNELYAGDQRLRPRLAWVSCDDCHKWRSIPAELADEIGATDCRWTCKDNKDKSFADCLIPQEKTNAEINAELEISDASGEEDSLRARAAIKGLETRHITAPQQASWALIKNNLFLHRSRRTQSIDEVMVCQCKRPSDGRFGCGDKCLNRMLNIECVRGSCPCGDQCSNQQFQRRKYAKFKFFRCGKKGYGLQLEEDVFEGSFLIEYVGEVLDLQTYEARQREYALRGQKHFYFMTLNGSEVIDACSKGNLGRFINHSCDPNCRTEKWMVNGEVCIGLFALRDIKKGEEVTFDYNYVRVFGAAAKKCVCGSLSCRGYIGGDPSIPETIVQIDSDDEYPEPVMVLDDGKIEKRMENITLCTNLTSPSLHYEGVCLENEGIVSKSSKSAELETLSAMPQNKYETLHVPNLEISLQTEDVGCSSVHAVLESDISLQVEGCKGKSSPGNQQFDSNLGVEDLQMRSLSPAQPQEITSQNAHSESKCISDTVEDSSKLTPSIVEEKPIFLKSRVIIKSSKSTSSSVKKGKFSSLHGTSNKPKKLTEVAGGGRFEGVEEKLNELLDADGGISKRKDATKGYLKLLFVTAASGDNVKGEAFQSTRDLSMVLDAILKTKSRMVLFDIINKNGLQMLHNIMKQNRRNFNKIPIIRKLLKVLEFLAMTEILTIEHINMAPPCEGVESFKDSIIMLTKHNDTQVHQIARNFRDRWIPRNIKRFESTDRFESQSGYYNRFPVPYRLWHDQGTRQSDAIECIGEAGNESKANDLLPVSSCNVNSDSNQMDGRANQCKRKSRWDQPAEVNLVSKRLHLVGNQVSNLTVQGCSQPPELHDGLPNRNAEIPREDSYVDDVEMDHATDDDGPPGFSSRKNSPCAPAVSVGDPVSGDCSSPVLNSKCSHKEVILGCHQKRFLGHLPVSYGIPLSYVQQLGTPNNEASGSWEIAPGLPFHPFPPLPKYPRGMPMQPLTAATHKRKHGIGDEVQPAKKRSIDPHINSPATDARLQESASSKESHLQLIENGRRPSSDRLGKRCFRQQKWNNKAGNSKFLPPPWVRRRNGWGFNGNSNSRVGATAIRVVGNETKESGSTLCHAE